MATPKARVAKNQIVLQCFIIRYIVLLNETPEIPMTPEETALLDQVTIDDPWALVESFATFKREHPDDVNRGMDEVVERLWRD